MGTDPNPADGRKLSMVSNPFSQGGSQGYLEIWNEDTMKEPIGWLTADDVFEFLEGDKL